MNRLLKTGALATAAALLSVASWAQTPTTSTPTFTIPPLSSILGTQTSTAKLESYVREAQRLGISIENIAKLALAAGFSVTDLTINVVKLASDPAKAVQALGMVFKNNPAALQSVYAAAVTVPNVVLTPASIAAALETGSGISGLSTTLSTASSTVNTTNTAGDTGSTTTNTNTSGGGSGPTTCASAPC